MLLRQKNVVAGVNLAPERLFFLNPLSPLLPCSTDTHTLLDADAQPHREGAGAAGRGRPRMLFDSPFARNFYF